MSCCRCNEELDTDLPPALDFRTDRLVCPQCRQDERDAQSKWLSLDREVLMFPEPV